MRWLWVEGEWGGFSSKEDRKMKLKDAKLCLDCDELYTGAQCPVCASGWGVFVRRWLGVLADSMRDMSVEAEQVRKEYNAD